MFTGLIEAIGTITRASPYRNYRRLEIRSALFDDRWRVGESVSCDGACLTLVAARGERFTVEASQETLARTIAGSYRTGSRVNLERALKATDRLGGHFVSGHVDGAGQVDYLRTAGASWELAVRYDPAFDPYVIDKGSVAINGVSLTVNAVRPGRLSVNIIPHTYRATTLGQAGAGQAVNLEFDMLAKYVVGQHTTPRRETVTVEKLTESGW